MGLQILGLRKGIINIDNLHTNFYTNFVDSSGSIWFTSMENRRSAITNKDFG
jgi:hypothetical protein